MKNKYYLPELPPGDEWLGTREVADLISPPVGVNGTESPKNRKDRIEEACERIYSYLSQGLPRECPFPKPDIKKPARNFWRKSTIVRWQERRGSLIIITDLEDEDSRMDH